jgi:NADP-dependent 3-hydroxy acid dehydrogenase YdfG
MAMLEHGAKVTIISSSQDRIDSVVKSVNNANFSGKVGNVREEESFISTLRSLAPIDHLIFSGVDKIIRGPIAEANFDDCKHLVS